MRKLSLLTLLGIWLAPAMGQAQASGETERLRPFTRAELTQLRPLLRQGTVGLVELPAGERLPGIHLATVVNAPPSTVAEIVATPEHYGRFMPAISDVRITERSRNMTGFSWSWQTSVFSLSGDAMLTLFEPPAAQPQRGYRIDVRRLRGDLGRGREIWRVLPLGRRSLVTLSMRVDLRESNYLTRQLSQASVSLNRSINLAMSLAMLMRTETEASRRAGTSPRSVNPQLHAPRLQPRQFDNLLQRGDLLLIEHEGMAMRQASVVTRLPHSEADVRSIMLNPVAFTEALIAGSQAEIREQEGNTTHFDWRVDLPLIGTSGSMQLVERSDRIVALDATSGAMDGGSWRFATQPLDGGATAVVGWAHFDVGDANFLLRAIIDADSGFAPGLNASTEIMMARALRIRVARIPH